MTSDIFLAPLGNFFFDVGLVVVGRVLIVQVLLNHLGLLVALLAVVLVEWQRAVLRVADQALRDQAAKHNCEQRNQEYQHRFLSKYVLERIRVLGEHLLVFLGELADEVVEKAGAVSRHFGLRLLELGEIHL